MRTRLHRALVLAAMLSSSALAQSSPDGFVLNVNLEGRFNFVVTSPASKTFSFGDVLPGSYTALAAFSWSSFGVPKRNVTISLGGALKTQGTGPSDMALGQLAIQFAPALVKGVPNGTPSATPVPVDSAPGTPLLSNIQDVGLGANVATGTIDLYLTVDDLDAAGANSWNVIITATQL